AQSNKYHLKSNGFNFEKVLGRVAELLDLKFEQVQKELGKGSEEGQEAREMRKKWWKFWGKGE
ncbi:MAG: hypothetical protein LWX51_15555, partial [Deltaproteobacteria bacterium]|nr:hypothetical protein [Deltaproteobacteria bacterium]